MLALEQREIRSLVGRLRSSGSTSRTRKARSRTLSVSSARHKVAGIVGGALNSFALRQSSYVGQEGSRCPYVAANAATGGSSLASTATSYTFRLQHARGGAAARVLGALLRLK